MNSAIAWIRCIYSGQYIIVEALILIVLIPAQLDAGFTIRLLICL